LVQIPGQVKSARGIRTGDVSQSDTFEEPEPQRKEEKPGLMENISPLWFIGIRRDDKIDIIINNISLSLL